MKRILATATLVLLLAVRSAAPAKETSVTIPPDQMESWCKAAKLSYRDWEDFRQDRENMTPAEETYLRKTWEACGD